MLYNPLEVDTLIIHPAKAAIVAARGISHSGLTARIRGAWHEGPLS